MSIIISLRQFSAAVLFVLLATGITWLVWPYNKVSPYAFYYLAAALATVYGGWRAGAVAVVIGALVGGYFFIHPFNSWQTLESIEGIVYVGVFAFVSAIIVWLIEKVTGLNATLEKRVLERTQALKTSEELNRSTLQALPAEIAVVNREGIIIATNQGWEAFDTKYGGTGKPSVSVGGNYLEACRNALADGDDTAAQALAGIEAVMTGRQAQFSMEYPCHTPEKLLWFHMTVVPAGTPLSGGAVITHLDITDRKLAERELVVSRQRFASIVESAMDGIISLDANQRILLFNAAAERILRCTAAEALGSRIDRFVPERFRATHHMHIERFMHSGETARSMGRISEQPLTGLRADGEEFMMEASISKLESADEQIVTVMLRDVTEIVRAETQLRLNEERMKLAFRATQDGVWDWNPETDEVFYSSRWKTMLGYDENEIEPHLSAWKRLVHPDDLKPSLQVVEEVMQSKRDFSLEYRMRHKDGHYMDILSRGIPIHREPGGPIVRIVGTHLDISKRKQVEADLIEADRRKTEFLSILAHELRNPLAPIRNAVHVLKAKMPPDPILQSAQALIDQQVDLMVRLIDDLLDISRISRGRMRLAKERTELTAVLNLAVESARPYLDQSAHALNVAYPAGPVYLEADPVRLTQIFLNLLNNAAKYTKRGGLIELKAELNGAEAIVSISDNGIGIPREHLDDIFEMFSQLTPNEQHTQDGLGIGLALTKGLVEMHGGTIEARSDGIGQGSRFIVRLPIIGEPAAQNEQIPASESIKQTGGLRILVADDIPSNVKALTMLLDMYGYIVESAGNGLETVDTAIRFQPDIILLDIGMPELDGYGACKLIREHAGSKRPLIIAMTGLGQDEDRRKSIEAGFDDHLVKPVNPSLLLQMIHSWYERN